MVSWMDEIGLYGPINAQYFGHGNPGCLGNKLLCCVHEVSDLHLGIICHLLTV